MSHNIYHERRTGEQGVKKVQRLTFDPQTAAEKSRTRDHDNLAQSINS